jgi:DNA-binding CsgD family transcriptional regulator
VHGYRPLIDSPGAQVADQPGDDRRAGYLVGRDAELERLRAFLATARTDGGALLVTGEPGVGKSELLDAASHAASAAGTRILRAAGIQFEAGMSFSGLNQVLLPLLADLPQLPRVHRDALNVALGFGEGPPPSRFVVSNAALALVRQAAASQPLLVVIDDLPWLDRASAGVLSFVARRLQGSPIGLLGASRTGEASFFERAGLPELEVPRLAGDAARQLVETRFPGLAVRVRERILEEAQGNPLALLELPLALGPQMRLSAKALPSALPLSRRLHALYGSRIAALPPRTRRLLLLMALDGTGDPRVLTADASIAGVDDLGAAERARIAYLEEATHRLAFHHPLIRAAVVDLSLAEERRTAHRELADVWASHPERRAWHLAEATVEPNESVAAQLEAAAARILARGDAVGCVKALTRSADLSPGEAERGRRLAAAAYIGADVAGDLSNASSVLAALRRGDVEVEGSLQAAVAASAFLLWADGDVATAHRLLVGALEGRTGAMDARDPVLAGALYSLMIVCFYGGDETLWQPFEKSMAQTAEIPVTLYLNSTTFVDPAHAGAVALAALDSAISGLADEADPAQIIQIGAAATFVDRLGACRDALWRVVRDARQGGAVASGIQAMIELAYDDQQTGDWDEAEQLVDEVIAACEAHGYEVLKWACLSIQAGIAAARGNAEQVEELAGAFLEWGPPRGIRVGLWYAAQARGLAALGNGHFEEAYQEASKISPAGVLTPHVPFALQVLMDLVEAAVRTGRVAEAAAHVAAMMEADLASVSPRLALVVGGCQALVAPDAVALGLFQATLAIPGIERWQFDLARVRLAYGERLRRRRAMTEARTHLRAALVTFQRLGARPWIDRTTAELRATGETKPRAGDDVLDRLTPQEFEIVSLAASGLTNKQIGERLFLSHRTVGGHLHRAFPKLGVVTRAALRDALASLPPEQRPRD